MPASGKTPPATARPTVQPPFDPEQYARESEQSIRSARPVPLPASLTPPPGSEIRLVHAQAEHLLPELEATPLDAASGDDVLESIYEERIGSSESVPYLTMDAARVRTLPLDAYAGFILSQVDGVSNVEMIVDVSGMPRIKALGILYELAERGVVDFR